MAHTWRPQAIALPATSLEYFVTAAEESRVAVWSLSRRERVAEYLVSYDGSCPPLLIAGPPLRVVSSCFYRDGVRCYDAFTGGELWRRDDILHVRQMSSLNGVRRRVVVYRAAAPSLVLDPDNGSTEAELSDVAGIWGRPDASALLASGEGGVRLLDPLTFEPMGLFQSLPADTIAFGKGCVALACHRSSSRVQNITWVSICTEDGSETGRYTSPKYSWISQLAWNASLESFVALENLLQFSIRQRLIQIRRGGHVSHLGSVPCHLSNQLSPDGSFIVALTGDILRVGNLSLVWRYDPGSTRVSDQTALPAYSSLDPFRAG